MPNPRLTVPLQYLALAVILALAVWLRVTGIGFGLPYLYQPDEPNKVQAALNIVKTGDLNPHYFRKPTLLIYANALLYLPYIAWAKATGRIEGVHDISAPVRLNMGVGHAASPEIMVAGRLLSAAVGTLVVLLTFLVGRRFFRSPVVPLLAALVVAVSFQHVTQSHYIEVNVFLVAALLGVCWASLRLYERGARNDYLLAGFLVGVAVTCKYPGVVGLVFPVAAHWLRSGRKLVLTREARLGLAMVPVGFFLGTPFALLDPVNFLKGAGGEAYHYATGHEGFEGNTPFWYLRYAWTWEGPLTAVAVLAIYLAIRRKDERLMLLASFPLVYFVFISLFAVRNGRTFMPLTPFAFLLAAGLLVELAGRLRGTSRLPARLLGALALVVVAGFGVWVPLRNSLQFDRRLLTVDSRETARIWIEEHVPAGSRIAIESFSPWVSPERYAVEPVGRAIDQPARWYAEREIQYVVFSQGMFQRYFRDPGRYRDRVEQYEALWQRFPLLKQFNDGDYEIRIHEVR
jgi:4-amino-4-deoxy-L-arabinose transferase-like glycosyltransferase